MTKKGGDSEFILRTAEKGSIYNKLYKKNLRTEHQVGFV